jgi:multidrug efflux pump subunit AcrA (membrane-fusion protein)
MTRGAARSGGARSRFALLALALSAACGSVGAGSGGGGRAQPVPLQVSRGSLEDRMVLTGELEALAAEQLRVPRTPAWTLAISWLAEDGAVVKKGEKVVEFDSTTLAESLDEKRSATVRADNELLSETARAAADLADKAMQVERASAELEKKLIEAGVPADLEAARTHQENSSPCWRSATPWPRPRRSCWLASAPRSSTAPSKRSSGRGPRASWPSWRSGSMTWSCAPRATASSRWR